MRYLLMACNQSAQQEGNQERQQKLIGAATWVVDAEGGRHQISYRGEDGHGDWCRSSAGSNRVGRKSAARACRQVKASKIDRLSISVDSGDLQREGCGLSSGNC